MCRAKSPAEDGTEPARGWAADTIGNLRRTVPETGSTTSILPTNCELFYKFQQQYVEGQIYQASTDAPAPGEPGTDWILALDPSTGEIKWRFELVKGKKAGLLATGGGLVFTGDREGYVFALDARTGKVLWHFRAGGSVAAAPITYSVDGKQVVAVASGSNILTFTLPQPHW